MGICMISAKTRTCTYTRNTRKNEKGGEEGKEARGISRTFPEEPPDRAGGGPGAITAIFSILKPRMSAENAPVFAMFVRLQNKQNEPAGSLQVAWGLFWARKWALRGHISLSGYRRKCRYRHFHFTV